MGGLARTHGNNSIPSRMRITHDGTHVEATEPVSSRRDSAKETLPLQVGGGTSNEILGLRHRQRLPMNLRKALRLVLIPLVGWVKILEIQVHSGGTFWIVGQEGADGFMVICHHSIEFRRILHFVNAPVLGNREGNGLVACVSFHIGSKELRDGD